MTFGQVNHVLGAIIEHYDRLNRLTQITHYSVRLTVGKACTKTALILITMNTVTTKH